MYKEVWTNLPVKPKKYTYLQTEQIILRDVVVVPPHTDLGTIFVFRSRTCRPISLSERDVECPPSHIGYR